MFSHLSKVKVTFHLLKGIVPRADTADPGRASQFWIVGPDDLPDRLEAGGTLGQGLPPAVRQPCHVCPGAPGQFRDGAGLQQGGGDWRPDVLIA